MSSSRKPIAPAAARSRCGRASRTRRRRRATRDVSASTSRRNITVRKGMKQARIRSSRSKTSRSKPGVAGRGGRLSSSWKRVARWKQLLQPGLGVEQRRLPGELRRGEVQWSSPSRIATYSPRQRRAACSQMPGDAEVALRQEGADPIGMARCVLAHDLPGAVGGEVVGDQELELEWCLLGEGAVERLRRSSRRGCG